MVNSVDHSNAIVTRGGSFDGGIDGPKIKELNILQKVAEKYGVDVRRIDNKFVLRNARPNHIGRNYQQNVLDGAKVLAKSRNKFGIKSDTRSNAFASHMARLANGNEAHLHQMNRNLYNVTKNAGTKNEHPDLKPLKKLLRVNTIKGNWRLGSATKATVVRSVVRKAVLSTYLKTGDVKLAAKVREQMEAGLNAKSVDANGKTTNRTALQSYFKTGNARELLDAMHIANMADKISPDRLKFEIRTGWNADYEKAKPAQENNRVEANEPGRDNPGQVGSGIVRSSIASSVTTEIDDNDNLMNDPSIRREDSFKSGKSSDTNPPGALDGDEILANQLQRQELDDLKKSKEQLDRDKDLAKDLHDSAPATKGAPDVEKREEPILETIHGEGEDPDNDIADVAEGNVADDEGPEVVTLHGKDDNPKIVQTKGTPHGDEGEIDDDAEGDDDVTRGALDLNDPINKKVIRQSAAAMEEGVRVNFPKDPKAMPKIDDQIDEDAPPAFNQVDLKDVKTLE